MKQKEYSYSRAIWKSDAHGTTLRSGQLGRLTRGEHAWIFYPEIGILAPMHTLEGLLIARGHICEREDVMVLSKWVSTDTWPGYFGLVDPD